MVRVYIRNLPDRYEVWKFVGGKWQRWVGERGDSEWLWSHAVKRYNRIAASGHGAQVRRNGEVFREFIPDEQASPAGATQTVLRGSDS